MLLLRLLLLAPLLAALQLANAAEDDFLDPDKAFVISARALDERQVEVVFDVAPGYYLYREQFKFQAPADVKLGEAQIPPGKTKFDETFQKEVATFHDAVRIVVPVQQAPADFNLTVTNQGCADRGLCYPPQQREVAVSLAAFGGNGSGGHADFRRARAAAAHAPGTARDWSPRRDNRRAPRRSSPG